MIWKVRVNSLRQSDIFIIFRNGTNGIRDKSDLVPQSSSLIAIHPRSLCSKGHEQWYLDVAERYQDKYCQHCRKCQDNRFIRHEMFFFSVKA